MPARVRVASWPGWTSRPMKALMRWLALLVLALAALQLFFALRIAAMAAIDPESSTFQRSEAWAQIAGTGRLRWRQQWVPYADHPAVGQEPAALWRAQHVAQGAGIAAGAAARTVAQQAAHSGDLPQQRGMGRRRVWRASRSAALLWQKRAPTHPRRGRPAGRDAARAQALRESAGVGVSGPAHARELGADGQRATALNRSARANLGSSWKHRASGRAGEVWPPGSLRCSTNQRTARGAPTARHSRRRRPWRSVPQITAHGTAPFAPRKSCKRY